MTWGKRPHRQSATTDAPRDLSPTPCALLRDAFSAATPPLRAARGRQKQIADTLFVVVVIFLNGGSPPPGSQPPPWPPSPQLPRPRPSRFKCLCLFLHDCCFGKRASAPAPATATPCEVRPSHCSKHRRTTTSTPQSFIPLDTRMHAHVARRAL